MYTKKQGKFLIKHYHDEAIAYRNEISQLTKQIPDFLQNEKAYDKLIARIQDLIIKRNNALNQLLETRKLIDKSTKE